MRTGILLVVVLNLGDVVIEKLRTDLERTQVKVRLENQLEYRQMMFYISINLLDPGEDIKFSEPSDVGGSYEAFGISFHYFTDELLCR